MMSIFPMRVAIVALALAGLCQPTTADAEIPSLPQITDLALRDGGVLVGQVVNNKNAPQRGMRVSLRDSQDREVAAAITNRQGSFTMSGIRGGVYQLVTRQGRQIYRIWPPDTAPPSAQQTARLVVNDEGRIIRAPGAMGTLIGAGVATAICVPVFYGGIKQPASP